VDGGIPQACPLLGETVTAHATRLSGSGLILLIAEGDRILDMTGGDPTRLMAEDHILPPTGPTLHMKGADHTPHTTGADHTLPMAGVAHTHLAMVIATVRDLHTVTEGGGHIPMTVLFHHTTAGAILQGTEDAAILAACRHAGATTRAAALQYQKNQGAVLRGKDTTKKPSHRAAGHLARGVLGRAMLTAAARTRGLSLGSGPAQLAPDGFRQYRHRVSLQPWIYNAM